MLKNLIFILFSLITITISCKSAKPDQIQYNFDNHIVRKNVILILDYASKEIVIEGEGLYLHVYYKDMPSESISKLPVRFEGKEIFRHFDVLDTNYHSIWAKDNCNDEFGFLEISKLDKKNNKISGRFKVKVCTLSKNDYKLITGSFKNLSMQLIPDPKFWKLDSP